MLSLVALAACSDSPHKLGLGSTCDSDAECSSGLCFESHCFDPVADSDDDTLLNGFEIGLGLDPRSVDSDGDGKPDPDELGPSQQLLDTDGDGSIDALESAIADHDGDCIVDELDPADDTPDPSGCSAFGSCDDVVAAGLPSGTYTVDPDGDGPEAAHVVQCAVVASGGWTRLDEGWATWLAHGQAPSHQYLYVGSDGSFLLSPHLGSGWSWTGGVHLVGPWFYAVAGGPLHSFDCGSGTVPSDAPGVGCFAAQGVAVAPQAAEASPTTGDVDLCVTGLTGLSGCQRYQVFERSLACAPDGGDSVLHDGTFDHVTRDGCWYSESLDAGGAGIGANIFVDTTTETAPSVRAEVYQPALAGTWYANLKQDALHLAEGHAYRWRFAAKASAPRPLLLDLSASDAQDSFAFASVALTTDWRTFEVPVATGMATLDAALRFYFGYDGEASVTLDDVRLVDAGDACASAAGELIGNGGFDAGLACWTNAIASDGLWQVVDSGGKDGGAYASVATYDGAASSFALTRDGLALSSGHAYALTAWSRGGDGDQLELVLSSHDGARGRVRTDLTSDVWAPSTLRFYVDPSEANDALWTLVVGITGGAAGPVDVDHTSLVDLGSGTTFCDGDPGFDFGLQCWSSVGDVSADFEFASEANKTPSIQLDNPGGTTPADVTLFRTLALTPGTTYEVRLRAVASEPQAISARVTFGAQATTWWSSDFTVATGWQDFSGRFQATSATTEVVLEIDTGGAKANTVWLDDVELVALPPTPR